MNAPLENIHYLKPQTDPTPQPPSSPPKDLSDKAKLFWNKTLEAGIREERLGPLQRAKRITWDYNVGAVKGLFLGMGHAVKEFLDPSSDFYNPDYREIFQDIQHLPDTALDHGIAYMDEDWEGRGRMNAEKSIDGGMWILKIYFGAKGLAQGIFKGAKKLFL